MILGGIKTRNSGCRHPLVPFSVPDPVGTTYGIGVPDVAVEVGVAAAIVKSKGLDQIDLRAALPLLAGIPDGEPEVGRSDHADPGFPKDVLAEK